VHAAMSSTERRPRPALQQLVWSSTSVVGPWRVDGCMEDLLKEHVWIAGSVVVCFPGSLSHVQSCKGKAWIFSYLWFTVLFKVSEISETEDLFFLLL
jgi:hypothetical protein